MDIILPILLIFFGAYLILTTPTVLFNFNWNKKTTQEKIKMVIFYAILIYLMNVIFWLFD